MRAALNRDEWMAACGDLAKTYEQGWEEVDKQMTDIEQKALALVNDCGGKHTYLKREWNPRYEALCRAIEQHEAFRQEVSDAVGLSIERCGHDGLRAGHINEYLGRFIIPAPKPDPLVEVLTEISGEGGFDNFDHYAHNLRAALDALGFEIREKGK